MEISLLLHSNQKCSVPNCQYMSKCSLANQILIKLEDHGLVELSYVLKEEGDLDMFAGANFHPGHFPLDNLPPNLSSPCSFLQTCSPNLHPSAEHHYHGLLVICYNKRSGILVRNQWWNFKFPSWNRLGPSRSDPSFKKIIHNVTSVFELQYWRQFISVTKHLCWHYWRFVLALSMMRCCILTVLYVLHATADAHVLSAVCYVSLIQPVTLLICLPLFSTWHDIGMGHNFLYPHSICLPAKTFSDVPLSSSICLHYHVHSLSHFIIQNYACVHHLSSHSTWPRHHCLYI